ncbi:MAG: hypothetical protein ABS76_33825 [Pelagibacterium sp. SCN 64-44]|nr:MAG: hypothetical protein ABS76_33825 [Pelagibacterium sp. SCN 64-44]
MLVGELIQWNDERGFGFIAGDDGARYFVHISNIGRIVTRPRIGDRLSFRPGPGRDGRPAALSASILGANPIPPRQVLRRGLPAEKFRLDRRLPLALVLAAGLVFAGTSGTISWLVLCLYLGMGAVSFALYGLDKGFAEKGHWRISEVTLLGCDLALGILGGLTAQAVFRHKTRKGGYVASTLVIAAVHLLWIGGLALGYIEGAALLNGLSAVL